MSLVRNFIEAGMAIALSVGLSGEIGPAKPAVIHGERGMVPTLPSNGTVFTVGRQEGGGVDAADYSEFLCSTDKHALEAVAGKPLPSGRVVQRLRPDGSVDLYQEIEPDENNPCSGLPGAFHVYDSNPLTSPGFSVQGN